MKGQILIFEEGMQKSMCNIKFMRQALDNFKNAKSDILATDLASTGRELGDKWGVAIGDWHRCSEKVGKFYNICQAQRALHMSPTRRNLRNNIGCNIHSL